MKKIKVLALCAISAMMLASCSQKVGEPQPAGISNAQIDSVSYAIGQQLGMNIAMSNFGELNVTKIANGIMDILKLSKEELNVQGQTIQEDSYMVLDNFMNQRQLAIANINQVMADKFFAENATAEGVVTSPTGLQYRIEREGEGRQPDLASTVTVNYEGTLLDGTVFDSSYDRGEPVSFGLTQVIGGWAEGLTYVKEGGEITLWIPAQLAYGTNGAGNMIGPNEALKFKVELISIDNAEESAE